MEKAVVVVGLGFGDEGKGATVDYLARELNADLVVRYNGGCQAAHHVVLPDGSGHCFSQFGSATLSGVKTYLGPQMIISPIDVLTEADELACLGVKNPLSMLQIDRKCLVQTWFSLQMNRVKELLRGEGARHGSCGYGIGETRSYWLKYGRDALCYGDLWDCVCVKDKLELMRQRYINDVSALHVCTAKHSHAKDSLDALYHSLLHSSVSELAQELLDSAAVCAVHGIPSCKTAIFEGAQGILLDEHFGFMPYCTHSNLRPDVAYDMIPKECQKVTLGVTRSYMVRHGAGPLPTYDRELTDELKDVNNPENPWQGEIKAGWIDMLMLEYAQNVAGVDGLVINHVDQMLGKHINFCNGYAMPASSMYIAEAVPAVSVIPRVSEHSLRTHQLMYANPRYANKPYAWSEVQALLEQDIAPVCITGAGRTYKDRQTLRDPFSLLS